MNTITKASTRNLSMECCKLIASFFVVFIHVPFPGALGGLVDCLGRFAVPTFFMISGYFNYRADSKAIARRTKHIFSLLVIGTLVHLVWGCINTELSGGSTIAYLRAWIFDPIEIVQWIVLHIHPYAGHLWYLNALIACYLCFWAYTKFWGDEEIRYQPFYYLSLSLFLICFVFNILPAANETGGVSINVRDGWLTGIPMFGLGLFIRQYQDVIFDRFQITAKKLVLVIVIGILFSVLQWYAADIGIMPFGTVFEVVALMLLLVSHPTLPIKSKSMEKMALHFGSVSTWIYILHLMLSLVYSSLLQQPLAALLGEKEPWLQPLVVLAMSIVAAIFCECVQNFSKKHHRKAK